MQTLDVLGEWWLPDQEDRRVAGSLRFDGTGGGQLELLEALRSPLAEAPKSRDGDAVTTHVTADALEQSGTYPRILGEADGKAFTLEDCFRTRLRNLLHARSPETVHVNQVLRGAWFEPDEALAATAARVEFRHLIYWLRWSGLVEHIHTGPSNGEPWAELTAASVPELEVIAESGAVYTLTVSQFLQGDRIAGRGFSQTASVRISVDELASIRDLLELAGDLQSIVAIGLRPVPNLESVSFEHPDLAVEDGRPPRMIDFIAQWADSEKETAERELPSTDVIFTLQDLGGASGLKRWIDTAAAHRVPLRRVMATRFRRMIASDELINRAAALEALDRSSSGAKNSAMRTRLRRLVKEAGTPFANLVHDLDRWVDIFVARRDDAAHLLEANLASTGAEDVYLAESAYLLFAFCILRRADAPPLVYDRIQAHDSFGWLSDRMKPVIRP